MENKILNELIEKYINRLIKYVDLEQWIEDYGIDVYTFLTTNIPYDVISSTLIAEASIFRMNKTEVRLLFRQEVIKVFNKTKNSVLLNRLDELMNV